MRFIFPHSHVTIDEDTSTAPECLIEFGDGVTVAGEWHPAGDVIELSVPAYRTARGTQIAAKRWKLAKGRDGTWRSELIA